MANSAQMKSMPGRLIGPDGGGMGHPCLISPVSPETRHLQQSRAKTKAGR